MQIMYDKQFVILHPIPDDILSDVLKYIAKSGSQNLTATSYPTGMNLAADSVSACDVECESLFALLELPT